MFKPFFEWFFRDSIQISSPILDEWSIRSKVMSTRELAKIAKKNCDGDVSSMNVFVITQRVLSE